MLWALPADYSAAGRQLGTTVALLGTLCRRPRSRASGLTFIWRLVAAPYALGTARRLLGRRQATRYERRPSRYTVSPAAQSRLRVDVHLAIGRGSVCSGHCPPTTRPPAGNSVRASPFSVHCVAGRAVAPPG